MCALNVQKKNKQTKKPPITTNEYRLIPKAFIKKSVGVGRRKMISNRFIIIIINIISPVGMGDLFHTGGCFTLTL